MWRRLIDWVLADTYMIDEKAFSVCTPSTVRSKPATDLISMDLLKATSSILVEREELIARTQELESRTGDPNQMPQMIRNLLPVVDAMERVLDFARESPPTPELDNWLKSVEGVYFRLMNTLERQGLEPIPAVGQGVDLNCQEVVQYIPSTVHPHDSVVSERQKGYRFRGKLIRDAKVVVAYNPKDR